MLTSGIAISWLIQYIKGVSNYDTLYSLIFSRAKNSRLSDFSFKKKFSR